MKKLLLATCLTAIFASGALGQDVKYVWSSHGYVNSFISPIMQFDSLWQFGVSSKLEFQPSYSGYGLYVLATDTVDYIQDTGRWIMYFGVNRDTLQVVNNCISNSSFGTSHMNFYGVPDSTGLLFEVSPNGVDWYNLLSPDDEVAYRQATGFASSFTRTAVFDTVAYLDGVPVFPPTNGWVGDMLESINLWHAWTWADAGSVVQSHLRVTYISKTFTPHAGVAFHSVRQYFWTFCEGLQIGETQGVLEVRLYPNPVKAHSVFELPANVSYPVQLTILDPSGRVLHQQTEHGSPTICMPSFLKHAGVYHYSIVDAQHQWQSGSFVLEE